MLKKSISMMLALACSLSVSTSIYANEPTPRPGPGVINDFTPSGGTVPKGLFGVVGNYVNAKKDRVWTGGNSHKAKNESTFNVFAIKPRVGLGNGWDLRASIPLIANDFEKIPSRNGLGDSILILRKQLISQDKGYPVSFGAGIGAVIPTGSTSYNGLGTGAWGLYGELGVTYAFDGGRQLVEAGLSYTWMGDGDAESPTGVAIDDIDQNDSIRAQARYAIAVNKNWDLGIEAQYYHVLESDQSGKGRNDSFTTIFAGPSVRFKIPQWKASIGVSPQFAIYQDFEAAKSNGAGPASESFRLEAQIQKVF